MQNKIIEPRYKVLSEKIIGSYKDELISSAGIELFLGRKFKSFNNVRKLTGGRISGVYQISDGIQDRVIKYSKGIYRMWELEREAEVLKYLNDKEIKHVVPVVRNLNRLDNFAYLVLDYFKGETIREKLNKIQCLEEKLEIWELAGQILSQIHTLCKSEDVEGEWLNEQLKLARINMESNIIDLEDFEEEEPEEVLEWLVLNNPRRTQICLLHGDFRTKNIMVDKDNNCKIIDWGFVDIGDPYYDLAIINYYFKDELARNSFYKGYGVSQYDDKLIEYYDRLSWFINV
ncbi:MAG: aminoglycoside phosphotransferase family protein [Ruminiclostridium sp.]|nr:aminoglycoside phosphotransferase family protein [Ruminiclostridium sp.]